MTSKVKTTALSFLAHHMMDFFSYFSLFCNSCDIDLCNYRSYQQVALFPIFVGALVSNCDAPRKQRSRFVINLPNFDTFKTS